MPKKLFLCSAVGGCESNAHRGSTIVAHFRGCGWEVVTRPDEADLVVVTTCGAAASLARKCRDTVTWARASAPVGVEIVVTGCLPRMPDHGLDGLSVRIVSELTEFDELAGGGDIAHTEPDHLDEGLYAYPFAGSGYRHVRLASGCLGDCAYCSVKFSIGALCSRPPEDVLADVRAGLAAGQERFFLYGDDCASYGADRRTDLPALLAGIAALAPGLHVALNYLEPQWLLRIYPRLRPLLGQLTLDYACIPLQSGSDRLLQLMRRRYRVAEVLDVVADLQAASPATELHTNLLVGFPTETDDDFRASMEAARPFARAHFVEYSERPGTRSVALTPKVPPAVIAARYAMLAAEGDPARFVAKSEAGRDDAPTQRSLRIAGRARGQQGAGDPARLQAVASWLRSRGLHPHVEADTVTLRLRDPQDDGVIVVTLDARGVTCTPPGAAAPRVRQLVERLEALLARPIG